jgi:hypothetical protein
MNEPNGYLTLADYLRSWNGQGCPCAGCVSSGAYDREWYCCADVIRRERRAQRPERQLLRTGPRGWGAPRY